MIHKLKILPEYFKAVADGTKTFEIRYNDRGFKNGDFIILREWDNGYSGRKIKAQITYILSNFEGLKDDYAVMAIKIVSKEVKK